MRNRTFLLNGLTIVMALLVSACGSSAGPEKAREAAPPGRGPSRGIEWSYEQFLAEPVEDGIQLPLGQAVQTVRFPILFPGHPMANRENLKTTWLSTSSGEIALVFRSGIVVKQARPQFPDAAANFAQAVLSVRNARVGLVRGGPALIIEPRTDPQGDNPGLVEFVHKDSSPTDTDGTYIVIFGDDVDGVTLSQMAETMTPA